MTDDNKTHGYYIVKWDRHPHELQEDTGIFQAVDVVCNDTHLNPIQQAHHCYTKSTIKTVVCVQHVLAANIEVQKTSSSIKFTKTCNCRDTVQKGKTKLPDCLQKGLLDEIIRRGALDFIKHEKEGHQDKEEY